MKMEAAIGPLGSARLVPNREAVDAYVAGESATVLAQRCGVSPGTFLRGLRTLGVEIRRAGRAHGFVVPPHLRKVQKHDIPVLLHRFDSGEPLDAIAQAYSVGRERVRQIAFANGREMRRKHAA